MIFDSFENFVRKPKVAEPLYADFFSFNVSFLKISTQTDCFFSIAGQRFTILRIELRYIMKNCRLNDRLHIKRPKTIRIFFLQFFCKRVRNARNKKNMFKNAESFLPIFDSPKVGPFID